MLFISYRRLVSHVPLVTTVTQPGSHHLQENAGKAFSVWRVQIALTLLLKTAIEVHAQKVIKKP